MGEYEDEVKESVYSRDEEILTRVDHSLANWLCYLVEVEDRNDTLLVMELVAKDADLYEDCEDLLSSSFTALSAEQQHARNEGVFKQVKRIFQHPGTRIEFAPGAGS